MHAHVRNQDAADEVVYSVGVVDSRGISNLDLSAPLRGSCNQPTAKEAAPASSLPGRDEHRPSAMSSTLITGACKTSDADIILAYRHIYKALLRAVQYSKPARFVAQDRVRNGFRQQSRDDYDALRISRTIELLDNAAKARGLEHKIVKNLMHAWWEQKKMLRNPHMKPIERTLVTSAYDGFNRTIEGLNDSMGLCIK